jgi:hypothetical protein
VVKHDAVVKDAHLHVWEAQVVACGGGEFFPVSDGVVADVADCASCEAEVLVGCCSAAKRPLDYVQWVCGGFFGFFPCLATGGGGSVFDLDGGFWVEADE